MYMSEYNFDTFKKELEENEFEYQKYNINDNLYFTIDDYDVRYFKNNRYVLEINTYPIKPSKLGIILFQVSINI